MRRLLEWIVDWFVEAPLRWHVSIAPRRRRDLSDVVAEIRRDDQDTAAGRKPSSVHIADRRRLLAEAKELGLKTLADSDFDEELRRLAADERFRRFMEGSD